MVFYEAPHKLLGTLADMAEVLGDRRVAVCREITKLHEQVLLFTLPQALEHFNNTPPKGEFVLVLEGYKGEGEEKPEVDCLQEVGKLIEQGQGLMAAVKQVSRTYNTPKNALYKLALERFGDKNEG